MGRKRKIPSKPHIVDSYIYKLRGKRWCILGLQGTGKTELAKYIVRKYRSHLVIDPMDEYTEFDTYVPHVKQYGQEAMDEIDLVINIAIIKNIDSLEMIVIDEANRWLPSKRKLPPTLVSLADSCRHYDLSFGIIARRPAQIATDFIELSHYIFIFSLKGKNDKQWSASINSSMPEKITALGQYDFLIVTPEREIIPAPPLEISRQLTVNSR